jgi:hypothetical protein
MPDAPWEKAIIRVLLHRCGKQPVQINAAVEEVLEIARQHGREQFKLGRTRGYERRNQGVDDHYAGE